MKKIIHLALSLVAFVAIVSSCKKVENQVTFDGGTAPALTSNNAAPLVLLIANKDNPAIAFSWTNPNYKFNTGTSSQDVTYTLQIDTAGSNFKNPKMSETVISKSLALALTVGELNKKLLSMELPWGVSKNFNARIKSSLINNTVPLFSNVVNFTATAYLDAAVTPPGTAPAYADGALFLVGSATPGGWNNPVPVPTQKFTRIDATHYELTLPMNGGQSYLMLPVNGDWSAKYGAMCSGNNCNAPGAYDFKAGGADLLAPATNGTYTIKVNFVSGKVTVQ
jgi:starch-binding outer membrane protein SusE/F